MKSVFGDIIKGWTDFPDNQLLRCPVHKKYEALVMMSFSPNSAFIDIGAHYGDTVVTMAMYAKQNNRDDIRFYAFEPNKIKCQYINTISNLNNLSINIINTAIGDGNKTVSADGISPDHRGSCSFQEDSLGSIVMSSLDEIDGIRNQIGLMHIDAEGWEARVINGASRVLRKNKTAPFIIAECWDSSASSARGFSHDPENDIISAVRATRSDFIRYNDLIDIQRNIVFGPVGAQNLMDSMVWNVRCWHIMSTKKIVLKSKLKNYL
jgi:FkbM family methyltransferase